MTGEAKSIHINPSTPLDVLAREFGTSIADVIPQGKGFVLVLFQGGKDAGFSFSTNTEENFAVDALESFLGEIKARIELARAKQSGG